MGKQTESDNVEVGLLRTFLAVAEYGSLGKTAAAVDKTQPAISQQMLRLEKILRQKLFTRGRNGITLTQHGRLLATYAHRVVELNEEILQKLRGETTGRRTAVGMSADVAIVGLAAAMKRFQSLHPELELSVIVTAPNKLDALLKAGKLDCAIGDLHLMTGTPAEKWSLRLEWAACDNFEFDRSRPIPLVLFEGAAPWQDAMLDSLHRAGRDYRVTFESASLDAILAAVQSGLGIAALPVAAIRRSALSRFNAIALPRAPMVEFGMFRSASGVSRSVQTSLEEALAPMLSASANDMAGLDKPVSDGPSKQFRLETSAAPILLRRRTQCRARYRTDGSILQGESPWGSA